MREEEVEVGREPEEKRANQETWPKKSLREEACERAWKRLRAPF
jgi:hypothetical protein